MGGGIYGRGVTDRVGRIDRARANSGRCRRARELRCARARDACRERATRQARTLDGDSLRLNGLILRTGQTLYLLSTDYRTAIRAVSGIGSG